MTSLRVEAAENVQDLQALATAGARWLQTQAEERYAGLRAETRVSPPDARLRLAACTEIRFALAPGSKPWGSGNLGVRCEAPYVWSLYTPFQIKLTGPSLVSKRALSARQPIDAEDVEIRQVEYLADPESHPRDARLLKGAVLAMPIQAGTPLRNELLRRPPLIKAGQKVRVLIDGPGYRVSQEGVAQHAGAAGEILRLKTASGRMIQGRIEADGGVRVEP